jgi:hypothetical protein
VLPCLTPFIKISFKWSLRHEKKGKTIKVIEEHTGEYVCALGVGKMFNKAKLLYVHLIEFINI